MYAIEFAFVFLIFFTFIYAIICYGILLTFRFGLQNAAEDGARAALRYQVNLEARQNKAKAVALAQTERWLPVTAKVAADVVYSSGSTCGMTPDKRCRIVVKVTASGLNKVLPPFPSFAIPDTLTSQASLLIDGRSL
ncbi:MULTISPECIES: TadE/TadG family type IV pilus assembly protein [unclassified Variovorax]|uniref:TadE/TadG family type IV pilus assembly protein n=1 Tax=unclassified Variovorax TaxID=663243 RepID=UPI002576717A|nr:MULTISPECIES: TadE/TadG family type IV pilus assembly protein [unclassified Variovorax]MDM0087710.1 pilus assembly protein [Variovorax sp. J22G40]MDM0144033.1 pilus assembly protein [Variovorax sp. J2P1-31]